MKFFKRRNKSVDYVDISLGRIFFYELKNVDVVNARISSEQKNGSLSNEIYIAYLERRLLPFKDKQYKKLSVQDGEIIRAKVLEILKKHNLILEEEVAEFTAAEKEWFAKKNKENNKIIKKI